MVGDTAPMLTNPAEIEPIVLSSNAPGDDPTVVLVHGALDQHRSFRRAARRITGETIWTYDRRGYGKSVAVAGAVDVSKHVDDLLKLVGDARPVVIGHSLGGLIALTAASLFPNKFSAIGAYEAPYRWKPWWPIEEDPGPGSDPADTVERFYRAMVGDAAWERSEALRAQLIAQGPALEVDLDTGRGVELFDAGQIVVPVRLAHGSESPPKYRRSALEMADDFAECQVSVIEGASHGAHLSHPDAFATFIETTIAARA